MSANFTVVSTTPLLGVTFETPDMFYMRVWHRKSGPMATAVWFYHPKVNANVWLQVADKDIPALDVALSNTIFGLYGLGVVGRLIVWLKSKLNLAGTQPPTPGAGV